MRERAAMRGEEREREREERREERREREEQGETEKAEDTQTNRALIRRNTRVTGGGEKMKERAVHGVPAGAT